MSARMLIQPDQEPGDFLRMELAMVRASSISARKAAERVRRSGNSTYDIWLALETPYCLVKGGVIVQPNATN